MTTLRALAIAFLTAGGVFLFAKSYAVPPIVYTGGVGSHLDEEQMKQTKFEEASPQDLTAGRMLSVCNPSDTVDIHIPLGGEGDGKRKPFSLYFDYHLAPHSETEPGTNHHQPRKVFRLTSPVLQDVPQYIHWQDDRTLAIFTRRGENLTEWLIDVKIKSLQEVPEIVGARLAIRKAHQKNSTP